MNRTTLYLACLEPLIRCKRERYVERRVSVLARAYASMLSATGLHRMQVLLW